MRKTIRDWIRKLGPGLITGAADDDPSGIATYSQAGAQFGFLTLWTVVFTYPLMVGIQLVSARIGRVTGHGLASNIGRQFPRSVLYAIVGLLVVANTINIAADIAAMGDALHLVLGRLRASRPVLRGICAASRSTPTSAWHSRTSSPSASFLELRPHSTPPASPTSRPRRRQLRRYGRSPVNLPSSCSRSGSSAPD